MKKVLLLLLFCIFIPAISYGQLYQGPASGSVPNGVVVSTTQFVGDFMGEDLPLSVRRKLRNTTGFKLLPDYLNPDQPTKPEGPEYIQPMERGGSNNPLVLKNYQGSLDPGNFIPPDFDVAVGPNHVITVDNGRWRIWDKNGNLVKSINTDQWFASTFSGANTFDPKIKYDHHNNRWILILLHQSDAPQVGQFLISVSDDSDPEGTWYNWAIPSNVYGMSNSGSWGDYQGVGFDDEAVYLTANQFFFGSSFQGCRIRILNKSQLYANTAGTLGWTDLWDIRISSGSNTVFGLRPAIVYGNPSEYYFIAQSVFTNGTVVYFYKLSNPLTSPVLTVASVPVATYFPPPNANQLGGGSPLLESGGFNFRHEPTYRNGFLWAVHAVSDGAGYSNVRYVKINTATNTAAEDYRFGDPQHYHTYPALAVDEDMNLLFTFSRSANDEYIGAYFAGRLNSDPVNTIGTTKVLAPGEANYVKTFGDTRNRWGDYNGAFVDPADQNNIWVFTEYAESPINTWAGQVGNIRLIPFSGPRIFTSTDSLYLGIQQVNTTSDTVQFTMYNYGDANLSISNVQSSSADFQITEVSSFPIGLDYRDSSIVKVVFKPTSAGDKVANITITSNDGTNPSKVVKVAGKGYVIAPVTATTIYGVASNLNNGDLVTLNRTTGVATSVGPTGYAQLNGLSILPSNKQLYGTISSSPTSQLLRVNAAGGDAYVYSNIPIGNVRALAFDLNDDLYLSTTTGLLYKYNINTGDTTFIGNTSISNLYGLTVNPLNGQLWASSLVGTVYKLNKSNATSTSVGATGIPILADICFDKNGNLFGVSGLSSQNSNLVSIDTSSGSGSTIGATTIQGINGIAISPEVVGVEPISSIVPDRYELYQNYPNPFNPVTNIKFDIPRNSSVKLAVYNSLGQKIAELFNGELTAGTYKYSWNAAGFASGIYFYRIETDGFVSTKKLVLLK